VDATPLDLAEVSKQVGCTVANSSSSEMDARESR